MKYLKTKLASLLALALTLTALAACSTPASATSATTAAAATTDAAMTTATATTTTAAVTTTEAAAGITIEDMTGRSITLAEPATRVVALTPSDCEILFAIGAGDTLVGRGEFCDYPAEVLELPAVQSGNETNLEQIIALQPQLLVMNTMAQTEEQVAQLEAAGIQVVVNDAKNIAGVYQSIELLGALMGKTDSAAQVVEGMKGTVAEVSAAVAELEPAEKSIYFEVSPLEYGLWTAGQGTFMHEAAELLELVNTFEDVTGWGEVSEEQVLERDPDFIVTVAMYFGEGLTPLEEIKARPGWENVSAIRNDALLNLANNELSRPGPRLADGVKMLYDFVYGAAAE